MKTQNNYRSGGPLSGNRFFVIIACIVLIVATQAANAQKRWSAEIRSGDNFATKDMGKANLSTGFGFEGSLAYRFLPHLAAYAGWSWNKFSAVESVAGSNVGFVETSYLFGLQFIHPIQESKSTT